MDLFRQNLTAFRGEIIRRKALFCVLAVFLKQIMLWYLPKSNFLFGLSRNSRCSKNRTLVEADSGPLVNSEDGAICNGNSQLKAVY